jgi:hypothetical protein
MPRCNEAIDKLLVVRPELQLQRLDIAVPLCFGTRARDGAADKPVLEHPCESEGNGSPDIDNPSFPPRRRCLRLVACDTPRVEMK